MSLGDLCHSSRGALPAPTCLSSYSASLPSLFLPVQLFLCSCLSLSSMICPVFRCSVYSWHHHPFFLYICLATVLSIFYYLFVIPFYLPSLSLIFGSFISYVLSCLPSFPFLCYLTFSTTFWAVLPSFPLLSEWFTYSSTTSWLLCLLFHYFSYILPPLYLLFIIIRRVPPHWPFLAFYFPSINFHSPPHHFR